LGRLNAAAKALGRAKQTILHWVHSGKLRSVQVRSGKRSGLRIELKPAKLDYLPMPIEKET
jgi:predicted site-specific integrase-resolvase